MIVYFADRFFNILGQASTNLIDGLTIVDDRKVEDIDSGVSTFEFTIPFNDSNRKDAESFCAVGNYLLRSHNGEQDFFTVIDCEVDTKRQEVTVYAEDAGLDLLNEIVGAYAPAEAHDIAHYVNKFAYDSGFVIGVNEVTGVTKKLAWDDDATATERIVDVAKQFDAEISYSFEIKGLSVTKKLINIYKERGNDVGVQLRLNKELDRIITKTSIANLATALLPEGGTPEDAENPINLSGYTYDDGDIYLEGRYLKSRSAIQKWSRYLNPSEPQTTYTGHILKKYSCEALTQADLCAEAVAHLKKISNVEVNYNVEFEELPDDVRIGDRVNIVDDSGAIYISARILELETSVANKSQSATIGEYLIKSGGIAQKVADLAEKYAKEAQATAKAYLAAKKAQEQANTASQNAANAQETANSAQASAETAQTAANTAQQAAEAAQTAANNAQSAANTAQEKANEAASSAAQAIADAASANAAVTIAQSAAASAVTKAETAQSTADNAKTQAESAATTAAAAKLDAENAQKDIDALGGELTTLSNTMAADYARKTDLTEATSSLQTQITQNADTIATHATQITTINETANDATTKAQAAQSTAADAKSKAETAISDAEAAQTAATNAATAAANAQSEADNAKTAADAAKSVADKAKQDLETAQANLATVQGRVDATEKDIATAQAAVTAAQAAADAAQSDATAAANAAATAQSKADTAAANAATAQTAADNAQAAADAAQKAADDAQADVDALAVRVTSAETSITQNAEQIALRATKQEVTQTLGGYYTKTEADAAIQVKADEINSTVATEISGLGTRVSTVEQTASGLSVKLGTVESDVDTAQTTADDAAKTATNFLIFEDGGLQVGNHTSGSWSGCRTKITGESFNILNNDGTILSSFGKNTIDLGNNDEDTKINMCNNSLKIWVDKIAYTPDPDDDASASDTIPYSVIESPYLGLRSTKRVGMNLQETVDIDGRPTRFQSTIQCLNQSAEISSSSYRDDMENSLQGLSELVVDPQFVQIWGEDHVEILGGRDSTKYSGIYIRSFGIDITKFGYGSVNITCGTNPNGDKVKINGYTRFSHNENIVDIANGNIDADGNATIAGALSAGNATIGGTLSTTGNATVGGALESGNATVKGTLSTTGDANIGGNVTANYVTGTWLQGTAANAASAKQDRVCVMDSSGWVYTRTLAQILGDIGISYGTWTASLNGGTITSQVCTYQKVGNMCTISFFITGTGGTGTAATNFYISGAPYTPKSGATWYGGGGHVQGLYDTANYPVTGCVIQPNKRIYFRTAQVGGTGSGYVRVNNGGAKFHLSGTITYPVA